jgi:hypothetical protein
MIYNIKHRTHPIWRALVPREDQPVHAANCDTSRPGYRDEAALLDQREAAALHQEDRRRLQWE